MFKTNQVNPELLKAVRDLQEETSLVEEFKQNLLKEFGVESEKGLTVEEKKEFDDILNELDYNKLKKGDYYAHKSRKIDTHKNKLTDKAYEKLGANPKSITDKLDKGGPFISGIGSGKFDNDTKEKLRSLRDRKNAATDRSFSNYKSSGVRSDTARRKYRAVMGEDLNEAIKNANSSGQGHDEDHVNHPLHPTITKYGFKYSHSTPIKRLDGSTDISHTYSHGEHKVSTHRPDSKIWDSSTSSASGHRHSGKGIPELEAHLKSKTRRYGLNKKVNEAKMDSHTAKGILGSLDNPNGDFHALHSGDVQKIVDAAKKHKYRKGKNAPGSTGRMFHQHITRLARRVNEDQLDEISKNKATDYFYAANDDLDNRQRRINHIKNMPTKSRKEAQANHTLAKNLETLSKKRVKGLHTALNKVHGLAKVPATGKLTMKEEAENIQEISRDLASRASHEFANKADKALGKKDYKTYKKFENARKLAVKKHEGRAKVNAVSRHVPIVKEENIQEISKATLGSYIKKASHDVATKSAATARFAERSNVIDKEVKSGNYERYREGRDNNEKANKTFNKSWKRRQGIAKATDKLTKEEVMNESANEHNVRELVLHADNDAQLHSSSHAPIMKNLAKKHAKGQYDSEKAKKLWKYHADRAADSYAKQYGSPGQKGHHIFSPADRKAAADHFEANNRDEMHNWLKK